MATLQTPMLTEDEYLRLERQADTKSEFHNGQIFAMAGGTPNHSLLANSIGALLRNHVPPGCRVFNADLRIHIALAKTFTYADCSVICGDLQYSGDQRDNVLNPLLIVEVLSPKTEGYDRGKKFELYRTIAIFQEYLLIYQDRRRVEHFSRQADDSWVLREYATTDAFVTFERLNLRIYLSELYADAINRDSAL